MISHSVIVHVKEERKIKNLGYFCFAIDVSTIYYRRLNHVVKNIIFLRIAKPFILSRKHQKNVR